MSDLSGVIRTGIYDKLTTGTNDFKTLITTANGTKLFYFEMPQKYPSTQIDIELPFVTFSLLPIESSRDSEVKFNDVVAQFNIAGTNLPQIEDIANKLTNELEDSEASLTFVGFTLLRIEEQPRITPFIEDRVWNMIVQYEINLQKES